MRTLRLCCAILALALPGAAAGCGGSDVQPEMPDPSVVDRSAEDLGLPEADPEAPEAEAGDDESETQAAGPPVRVVAGESEPIDGSTPTIRIVAPRAGATIARGDVSLRLRLTNWQLAPAPGRHVHVIVDNEPYIAVRDVRAPLNLNALVRDNLGHELAEGSHVVRVFPSRGHHESVKASGAFAAVAFHYVRQTEGFEFDADGALLTFSRPKGCNPVGERVLLDFYVDNAELGADAFRVRYNIDEQVTGDITDWAPHWIEDLAEGPHTIGLTLIGADGAEVAGPFNRTTRTFQVAASCE